MVKKTISEWNHLRNEIGGMIDRFFENKDEDERRSREDDFHDDIINLVLNFVDEDVDIVDPYKNEGKRYHKEE